MLQILDNVRVHELPSAAGLVLRLASQSSGPARLAAVKAVRQRLRMTPQAMTPGVLDAFRLVVMQHPDVAQEIVEGIDRQCSNLATGISGSQAGSYTSLSVAMYLITAAHLAAPGCSHTCRSTFGSKFAQVLLHGRYMVQLSVLVGSCSIGVVGNPACKYADHLFAL